jgi:uncharacterized protein with NRDE domain
MCLLVFAWQVEPGYPLVVAANRDERLDRPAESLCVLQDEGPRILGGRDQLGGGTWLAVNEHGLVAGLTNRPSPGGRDPAKRSRGELPLMLAGHRRADAAVAGLVRTVRPDLYNPAWLLVGDRDSLFAVELHGEGPARSRQLEPGIHVLENVPLGEPSPKVDRVRGLLSTARSTGAPLWDAMRSVLADHVVPEAGPPADDDGHSLVRPAATRAACVHTEEYGTRSAALIRVPSHGGARPDMEVADGPSCTTPFVDVGCRWSH